MKVFVIFFGIAICNLYSTNTKIEEIECLSRGTIGPEDTYRLSSNITKSKYRIRFSNLEQKIGKIDIVFLFDHYFSAKLAGRNIKTITYHIIDEEHLRTINPDTRVETIGPPTENNFISHYSYQASDKINAEHLTTILNLVENQFSKKNHTKIRPGETLTL